jgi:hypothetical protein
MSCWDTIISVQLAPCLNQSQDITWCHALSDHKCPDISMQLIPLRATGVFDGVNAGTKGARLLLSRCVLSDDGRDNSGMKKVLERRTHADCRAGKVSNRIKPMPHQVSGSHHYLNVIVEQIPACTAN